MAANGRGHHTVRMRTAQRRTQLASVAAQRIHRLGYHRVSLADVGQAAGVTGPAIYRHFRNKEALLAAAIDSGLDLVERTLARAEHGSLDELMWEAADAALERPDLWVLLQRESRFLGAETRGRIQERFGCVADTFLRHLCRERPDLPPDVARLIVTATTSVLSAPSVSRAPLPRDEFRRELAAAAAATFRVDLRAPVRALADDAHLAARVTDGSRRAEVLDAAVDLFFQRGYSAATLDEIGASVGIAGPSLYHHFATKADILVAAFDRAVTELRAVQAHTPDDGATSLLDAQVSSYVNFCLRNRALVGVYVCEVMNLPPAARTEILAVIRREVSDWRTALTATLPGDELTEGRALVRVRAAMAAIHDLVRLGQFHNRPRVAAEIETLARAVLLRA